MEQDLREPKPETVQNIYGAILADLLSLDVRSFERDGQLAIGEIDSPVSMCTAFTIPLRMCSGLSVVGVLL